MPYKSDRQRRFFNANREELEAEGVDVDEWNESSKGKDLPEKAPEKKSTAALGKAAAQQEAGLSAIYHKARRFLDKTYMTPEEKEEHRRAWAEMVTPEDIAFKNEITAAMGADPRFEIMQPSMASAEQATTREPGKTAAAQDNPAAKAELDSAIRDADRAAAAARKQGYRYRAGQEEQRRNQYNLDRMTGEPLPQDDEVDAYVTRDLDRQRSAGGGMGDTYSGSLEDRMRRLAAQAAKSQSAPAPTPAQSRRTREGERFGDSTAHRGIGRSGADVLLPKDVSLEEYQAVQAENPHWDSRRIVQHVRSQPRSTGRTQTAPQPAAAPAIPPPPSAERAPVDQQAAAAGRAAAQIAPPASAMPQDAPQPALSLGTVHTPPKPPPRQSLGGETALATPDLPPRQVQPDTPPAAPRPAPRMNYPAFATYDPQPKPPALTAPPAPPKPGTAAAPPTPPAPAANAARANPFNQPAIPSTSVVQQGMSAPPPTPALPTMAGRHQQSGPVTPGRPVMPSWANPKPAIAAPPPATAPPPAAPATTAAPVDENPFQGGLQNPEGGAPEQTIQTQQAASAAPGNAGGDLNELQRSMGAKPPAMGPVGGNFGANQGNMFTAGRPAGFGGKMAAELGKQAAQLGKPGKEKEQDMDSRTDAEQSGKAAAEKQAIVASNTGLLGGALGALNAPMGHRTEGYGRGARRGALTGLGTALGAGVGGIGGALLGRSPEAALWGLSGGGALGALGGYAAGGLGRPSPSWETGDALSPEYRQQLLNWGSVIPGLSAAGAASIASKAMGAGWKEQLAAMVAAGLPTTLAAALLMNNSLPPMQTPDIADGSQKPPQELAKAAELGKLAAGGYADIGQSLDQFSDQLGPSWAHRPQWLGGLGEGAQPSPEMRPKMDFSQGMWGQPDSPGHNIMNTAQARGADAARMDQLGEHIQTLQNAELPPERIGQILNPVQQSLPMAEGWEQGNAMPVPPAPTPASPAGIAAAKSPGAGIAGDLGGGQAPPAPDMQEPLQAGFNLEGLKDMYNRLGPVERGVLLGGGGLMGLYLLNKALGRDDEERGMGGYPHPAMMSPGQKGIFIS